LILHLQPRFTAASDPAELDMVSPKPVRVDVTLCKLSGSEPSERV
jgi:hypothetical protein